MRNGAPARGVVSITRTAGGVIRLSCGARQPALGTEVLYGVEFEVYIREFESSGAAYLMQPRRRSIRFHQLSADTAEINVDGMEMN